MIQPDELEAANDPINDLDPRRPLEYRTASTLEVRHGQRTIDLIAVPYDERCEVNRRGRWVTETVDRGAFLGVAGDVIVNRAHDLESPLGSASRGSARTTPAGYGRKSESHGPGKATTS